ASGRTITNYERALPQVAHHFAVKLHPPYRTETTSAYQDNAGLSRLRRADAFARGCCRRAGSSLSRRTPERGARDQHCKPSAACPHQQFNTHIAPPACCRSAQYGTISNSRQSVAIQQHSREISKSCNQEVRLAELVHSAENIYRHAACS